MYKIGRVKVFFGVGITACLLGLIAFSLMHTEDIRAVGGCEPELALECEPPNVFMNCQCRPPWPTPIPTPLAYGPKGVGDPWQNWTPPKTGTNLSALNYDWYYDWQVSYVPGRENDPRYVRMVWCTNTDGIVAAASSDYANGIRGRVWLIYNEPDHENGCGANPTDILNVPMNRNPAYAAHHFSDIYDMIKGADPYARVFGGGLVFLNTGKSYNWWKDFVLTLQTEGNLYKLEGVHVHLYPLVSTSTNWPYVNLSCDNSSDDYCVPELAQVANQWYSKTHASLKLGDNNILDLSDRPIWITEMGRACTGAASNKSWSWVRNTTMEPLSQWFNSEIELPYDPQDTEWPYDPQVALNPGYDAVAWFSTYYANGYLCSSLLDSLGPNGITTTLGGFWNAYQP